MHMIKILQTEIKESVERWAVKNVHMDHLVRMRNVFDDQPPSSQVLIISSEWMKKNEIIQPFEISERSGSRENKISYR